MMRYLLDTHALVWFLQNDPALPDDVATRIEDARADVAVSMASVWEMSIKISIGKLRVPYDLSEQLPGLLKTNDIRAIAPDFEDFALVSALPFHHRDPFDRLIVAQSIRAKRTIISRDTDLDPYDTKRLWG